VLAPNQVAFCSNLTTHHHILALKLLLEEAKYRGIPLMAVFLDLEKAYDSLPHVAIPMTLKHYGLNKAASYLIAKLYRNTTATVNTLHGPTEPFPIQRGVKQGNPLSPLLWNLFINPGGMAPPQPQGIPYQQRHQQESSQVEGTLTTS